MIQTNLFGEVEKIHLTIEQAAKIANVSTATIRNWIKTGYLSKCGKGCITQDSLENFLYNIAGKEKLNLRANKSFKDQHDHDLISNKISYMIKNFKGEHIGIEYEQSLSDAHRNKEGIYYTPTWIVRDMLNSISIDPAHTFLDPCCGSGNFIIEAIKVGIRPENVYGYDTDENAVLITKERIKHEFGYKTQNIRVGDFLKEVLILQEQDQKFDLIFTNPPWGKKISRVEKERLSSYFNCGNSLDTTSLFMAACFNILNPETGILGFLIQEALFNISTFEDIRKKVLSKKILYIFDYGKPFKGLLTKAQAIIIKNSNLNSESTVQCRVHKRLYYRSLNSFKNNPKKIINFWADEKDQKVINRLYSVKHITLEGKAKWALGIVTGNNKKFCISHPKDGYIPVYKGSDITKTGLKEPSTYIIKDFSKFQQVAPLDMYLAKEKLIYRFISSDLCFYYDDKQRFILNSANLLIPCNMEITTQQLCDLLNSEIINWLFKKLFATHKVLRGDLELLPIHYEYFHQYKDFKEELYLNYLQIERIGNGTYRIKK